MALDLQQSGMFSRDMKFATQSSLHSHCPVSLCGPSLELSNGCQAESCQGGAGTCTCLPAADKIGPRALARAPRLLRIPITVPFWLAEPVQGKVQHQLRSSFSKTFFFFFLAAPESQLLCTSDLLFYTTHSIKHAASLVVFLSTEEVTVVAEHDFSTGKV